MHGQGLGSRGARRRRRRARGFPAIRETRVRRSSRCARYHPPSPTYTRLRLKGTARRCSFPGRTARHRAVIASSRRGLEARPVRPAAARDRRRPALPDVGMSFDRATDSGIALFLPGRNVPQSRLVRTNMARCAYSKFRFAHPAGESIHLCICSRLPQTRVSNPP